QAQKVTAIAMGSTEVKTTDLMKNCDEEEALQIAAESIGLEQSKMKMAGSNGSIFVVTAEKDGKTPVRMIDKKGFVKVQRSNGTVLVTTKSRLRDDLKL
ncbi:hydantoinase/oxoprolinase family protein, partial [Clostridioides difficile]|nr:hydantoinase/oxoprolinase family protein [Clostridioides difficile]